MMTITQTQNNVHNTAQGEQNRGITLGKARFAPDSGGSLMRISVPGGEFELSFLGRRENGRLRHSCVPVSTDGEKVRYQGEPVAAVAAEFARCGAKMS